MPPQGPSETFFFLADDPAVVHPDSGDDSGKSSLDNLICHTRVTSPEGNGGCEFNETNRVAPANCEIRVTGLRRRTCSLRLVLGDKRKKITTYRNDANSQEETFRPSQRRA